MKRNQNVLGLTLLCGFSAVVSNAQNKQPNVILILVDDMGYSDIGCYGGEIQTPNIDKLASEGIKYTQFYNCARSCPTRASLLTGLYPHQAGMGWMTVANLGTPQYQGELNNQCMTIAEVLKTSGYSTYMCGKWHLTRNYDESVNGENYDWPLQRGFDRFFGTINGGGSYFNPNSLTYGNKPATIKQPFYYTEAIADSAVSFIENHKAKNPFFMYVAFTAPHWPLHAKESDIQKYKGKYDKGWDFIRGKRFEKMKNLGIIPPSTALTAKNEDAAAWYTIPDRLKPELVNRMEIYAAQIDNMDQGVGKIIDELKRKNEVDNTLIVFLSDNGGCAEMISDTKKTGAIGTADSFESYSLGWANVSNTPFKLFKHWTHEGGIATPLIVHWPDNIKRENQGLIWTKPGHVVDIMATFVDAAKADYPSLMNKNKKIQPLEGQSLLPTFQLKDNNRKPIFWEHEANIAMRDGSWKLVAKSNEDSAKIGRLELYNIDEDRSESTDLSSKYPEKTKKMYESWLEWGNRIKVFPLDTREYNVREKASRMKEKEIWMNRRSGKAENKK